MLGPDKAAASYHRSGPTGLWPPSILKRPPAEHNVVGPAGPCYRGKAAPPPTPRPAGGVEYSLPYSPAPLIPSSGTRQNAASPSQSAWLPAAGRIRSEDRASRPARPRGWAALRWQLLLGANGCSMLRTPPCFGRKPERKATYTRAWSVEHRMGDPYARNLLIQNTSDSRLRRFPAARTQAQFNASTIAAFTGLVCWAGDRTATPPPTPRQAPDMHGRHPTPRNSPPCSRKLAALANTPLSTPPPPPCAAAAGPSCAAHARGPAHAPAPARRPRRRWRAALPRHAGSGRPGRARPRPRPGTRPAACAAGPPTPCAPQCAARARGGRGVVLLRDLVLLGCWWAEPREAWLAMESAARKQSAGVQCHSPPQARTHQY